MNDSDLLRISTHIGPNVFAPLLVVVNSDKVLILLINTNITAGSALLGEDENEQVLVGW